MKKEPPKAAPTRDFKGGIHSLFEGLGELLEVAARVAQSDIQDKDSDPMGADDQDSVRAVYGVSVRVAPGSRPSIQRFGNVRQRRGEQPSIERFREPLTDLLDQGDHFLVVAELPGLEQSGIRCSVSGKKLLLTAQSGARKYIKKLALPSPVDETRISSNYKNGVLELRLWKKP